MNGMNSAIVIKRNQRARSGAKMLGIFALGAITCSALTYLIVSKPAPAVIAASQPPTTPPVTNPGSMKSADGPATSNNTHASTPTIVVNIIQPREGEVKAYVDQGSGLQWPLGFDPRLVGPPLPAEIAAEREASYQQRKVTLSPDEPIGLRSGDSNSQRIAASPQSSNSPAAAVVTGSKININTATGPQLELLPGIGPATAKRIIDHRTAKGPFRTAKDLDDIKGIGEKTVARILPYITFESDLPER